MAQPVVVIQCQDKSITLEQLVELLAHAVLKKEWLSQREASTEFGRSTVERWRNEGLAHPVVKGKKKLLYSRVELEHLLNNSL